MVGAMWTIDVESICLQAYYECKRDVLSNDLGEPVGTAFGFIGVMADILEMTESSSCCAVIHPRYSGGQAHLATSWLPMVRLFPQGLGGEMERIERLVKVLGLGVVRSEVVRSGSLLTAVVKEAVESKAVVVIVSAEKELLQLINDWVMVYDPFKRYLWREEEVSSQLGVPPALVPDLLALCGGPSREFAAPRGLGEEEAARLLREFGSLDGVLGNIDKVTSSRLRSWLRKSDLALKGAHGTCQQV